MKVLYLTWGETPRNYGIFRSQVINQFAAGKRKNPAWQFYFISAIPLVHSGLIREKLGYAKELKRVIASLNNIAFKWIPIYAPQNFVNSNPITFYLFHFGAEFHLAQNIRTITPDIVHCRSYHAAWAAIQVREKYMLPYKVIFDARGLWCEEIALKKGYSSASTAYRFLKNIETVIVEKSDSIISVSIPMKRHFESLGARHVKNIYLSAPTRQLANSCQRQQKQPMQTVLCYVGALSRNTWHEPKYLVELYLKFRQEVDNPKLLIVTTSNSASYTSELASIPTQEVEIVSAKDINELKCYLDMADFGALSYFIPNSEMQMRLADTILAVKTVEYLSAGLPVLVNRYCGGARDIVEEFGLGISYSPETLVEINRTALDLLLDDETIQKARRLSQELFDYDSNATRYSNLYQSLMHE